MIWRRVRAFLAVFALAAAAVAVGVPDTPLSIGAAHAAYPTGGGYFLAARDGGMFTFGDAQFLGSTGAMKLNAPIVGMAATPFPEGYWLVAEEGGVFPCRSRRVFRAGRQHQLHKPGARPGPP